MTDLRKTFTELVLPILLYALRKATETGDTAMQRGAENAILVMSELLFQKDKGDD